MTTTQDSQLLAAFAKQQHLLEKILAVLDKPNLGFTNDTGIVYVYCNRQHGCLWYSLDAERKPVAIPHAALTGYLRELRFEKVERRGREVYKLLATIKADRLYILESGHDSHFSKGLLTAIASLTPQQLMQPITIQPSPGDDDAVLFCRVWCGSEIIKASYNETSNFREISKKALAVVRESQAMPY
jgi:hypothetical protein